MEVKHNIPPIYDKKSKILILGSFPSVKSREAEFFYGNPQNRFWRVLAGVYSEDVPCSVEEKKLFLKLHKIALWDVIGKCDIEGSADSSIKNAEPNDIGKISDNGNIKCIFLNGQTAKRMYERYLANKIKIKTVLLPSTSPANAAYRVDKLVLSWKQIKEYTDA